MTSADPVTFHLVYQAGLANVFTSRPDHFTDRNRVYQGDFRTAEAICRGALLAGSEVRVWNVGGSAGDAQHISWMPGKGGPFEDSQHPPV